MADPFLAITTNVVTQLRLTVGDPDTGTNTPRWSAGQMADFIMRGEMQVILDEPRSNKTVWEVSMVDAQREYGLPTNFLKANFVVHVKTANTDLRPLDYMPWSEYKEVMNDEDAKGDPQRYYFWRKMGTDQATPKVPYIALDPTPNSTDTIRIFGYKVPDDASTTTSNVLEVEVLLVEAVVMYAASIVMEDDDEPGRASQFLGRYEQQMEKIRGVLAQEDRAEFSRIIPKGFRRRGRSGYLGRPPRWG